MSAELLSRSTTIPVAQGAEAKVYKAYLLAGSDGEAVLLKHRFQKSYRHPTLDASLTRSRIAGEARALMRCMRAGVSVPGLRMVDAQAGLLGIEWIDGSSVRRLLPGGIVEDMAEDEDEPPEEPEEVDPLLEYGVTRDELLTMIGAEIGKMHKADIIHGDLTTSNMMLRRSPAQGQLLLIDFGLAYTSSLVEDKAVDLYVLERAFSSTHPEQDTGAMFAAVLKAYEVRMGPAWDAVRRRLDDVRLRGRKRSMVG